MPNRQLTGDVSMKQLKSILIGLVIGALIGLALGVNIGREKPLLSNPFAEESLADRVKRLGSETLEQGGKALEQGGKALEKKAQSLQGK
jgi:hypothetical protein